MVGVKSRGGMDRIYQKVITDHFNNNQQMLFLAGPRQVGKSTISLAAQNLTGNFVYLNWDESNNRETILRGEKYVAEFAKIDRIYKKKSIIVFDEIHKYPRWKNFLKGFYDYYKEKTGIIVTGSAKLDVYRKGADSLMGRYFLYRIHPFSVAECVTTTLSDQELRESKQINGNKFKSLWAFGGFPEPFIKQDKRFYQRWKNLRTKALFREDIRDLTNIQEITQLEIFAQLLKHQASQLLNFTNLSRKSQISVNTVKRWINTLESFYYCFLVRPWTKNITRSLIKEPKLYLWDWSLVDDEGGRAENFIASHLLKATHFWTDSGFGEFSLYFLRDKDKREVDFLVTKNNKPWFLVEAKKASFGLLSKSLEIFQKQTGAKHAFQVVLDMDYVDVNCFKYTKPIIVPAKTFLSQLI
jgi:uncharacterized protein